MFGPEGRFLAIHVDQSVLMLPLQGSSPSAGHTVFEIEDLVHLWFLTVSPDGEWFGVSGSGPRVWIGQDDGQRPREIHGVWTDIIFSPDGRHAALTGGDEVIGILDLTSERMVAQLRPPDGELRAGMSFTDDGRLLHATSNGVAAWDVETGRHELLVELNVQMMGASADGRRLLVLERGDSDAEWDPVGSPVFIDLDAGVSNRLDSHGTQVWDATLSRDGTVVATGGRNGIIRVGPATGEDPHLLLGHEYMVTPLDIDPLGRWVASGGVDNTIRLWPMPDLTKPPLHTLPREELIAKLKMLTNVRMAHDPDSSTGWTLTHDPFRGWETVPTW
jgi:WD40 repeat protein